jgi:hypothetical protein
MSRNRRKAASIAGVEQAMLQREEGEGGERGGGGSGFMSSPRSVLIDVGSVSSPESVLNRRLVVLLYCLTQRVFTADCDLHDLRVNHALFNSA